MEESGATAASVDESVAALVARIAELVAHADEYLTRVARGDEAAVSLAACLDSAVARVTTPVEFARTLMACADEAFHVYNHLEHALQATVAHELLAAAAVGPVHLVADVGFSVLADSVGEEERNSRAYVLFTDMVDAEPDLDPSF